jgi:hypothetical protein
VPRGDIAVHQLVPGAHTAGTAFVAPYGMQATFGTSPLETDLAAVVSWPSQAALEDPHDARPLALEPIQAVPLAPVDDHGTNARLDFRLGIG